MYFFSDSKNALILYLLPLILKPTGRPQLPIPEAQENLIKFVTDVRRIAISKEKDPRVIVVFKSITGPNAFDEIIQITFYMLGTYYITSTVLEAIEHLYMSYWVFFTDYNKAAHNCLHFIMKHFFDMNYVGEKCSPATTKLLKRLQN